MEFKLTKGYEDYAIFPMNYLRITQSYDQGNHIDHWKGANYVDYPIDVGGMDSGRDYLFAPVDMKVTALSGIGNKLVSNKIFLESVNKVKTPKWGTTKIFMTAVHFENSDVSKFGLSVGKIIKAGQPICFEGRETATANHLHLTCGIGSSTKSIQNNKGKWVTKGNCKKPEEIFYIDPNFTIVKNMGGLKFVELPKREVEMLPKIGSPVLRDTTKKQIEVLVDTLRMRSLPTTSGKVLGYIKKGIYDYGDIRQANNYTWYKVENGWIAFNDLWCKLYEKEVTVPETEENLQPSEMPSQEPDVIKDDQKEETEKEEKFEKNVNLFIAFFQKVWFVIKKVIGIFIKF